MHASYSDTMTKSNYMILEHYNLHQDLCFQQQLRHGNILVHQTECEKGTVYVSSLSTHSVTLHTNTNLKPEGNKVAPAIT